MRRVSRRSAALWRRDDYGEFGAERMIALPDFLLARPNLLWFRDFATRCHARLTSLEFFDILGLLR
jgi:hypothetical protein